MVNVGQLQESLTTDVGVRVADGEAIFSFRAPGYALGHQVKCTILFSLPDPLHHQQHLLRHRCHDCNKKKCRRGFFFFFIVKKINLRFVVFLASLQIVWNLQDIVLKQIIRNESNQFQQA